MSEADRLRGHDFMPPLAELVAVPALYATEETPLQDKTVWLHFFVGACDWWVMEYDPDEDRAFGYVNLGDPWNAELGYFMLGELREVVARGPNGLPLVVERDLHWSPTRLAERPTGR